MNDGKGLNVFEAGYSEKYTLVCVPREDSNQPAHLCSLIRVFAGRFNDSKVLIILHTDMEGFESDCVEAHADLSLHLLDMPSCTFRCAPAHLM